MSKVHLVIVGAGGHGSEIVDYVHALQDAAHDIELLGFVDDAERCSPERYSEMLGPVSALTKLGRSLAMQLCYLTAVGDNRQRAALVRRIGEMPSGLLQPWSLLHPNSYVSRSVQIGLGTCLAPGSVVTTNVVIGMHCIINVNASIAHDCELGDFVNLNPNVTIAGDVRIGQGAYIGAGATVIDKVSIGDWAVVGAGAVVTRDVPPGVTVVGVPAREHHKSPA